MSSMVMFISSTIIDKDDQGKAMIAVIVYL